MKQKTYVRNGLKDVQSRIRKGEKGLVIFAGDVTPVEVMCHLPAVCEEKGLPYVFTPSRALLGQAMGVKRGSLMVMIRKHEDYNELFDECKAEVEQLPTVVAWDLYLPYLNKKRIIFFLIHLILISITQFMDLDGIFHLMQRKSIKY